jgi:aryl-alcohol dehydrogenase-like predicted oxidoreductase
MKMRRLGTDGPAVSAIGLGCMALSDVYGPADEAESVATIHAALDAGVTLIDTGDFYGMGDNEMLIGRALRDRPRDRAFIAVKFGALRSVEGHFLGYDGRPAAVRNFLAYTLKRLGTDYVDLYQPARIDPNVPVEETVGAIADMVEAGYVRYLGLSEAGPETIRRAHAVHPVTALQIEYSLMSRGVEGGVLDTLRELGIGMTAYGVLSRGLLGGTKAPDLAARPQDIRNRMPRYQGENLAHNLALVEALAEVAAEIGATPSQLAFAWVLSRGEDIVPLAGARRRDQLDDALGSLDIDVTPDLLARIEAAVPAGAVAGERYDPRQLAMLDSERG